MRHSWQSTLVLLVLMLTPRLGAAVCAGSDGVAALADSRAAHGVVTDLELMRAWHGELKRNADHRNELHGPLLEVDEPGFHQDASWLWWSDSFDGFRLCDSGTPVDLDRNWWGAHARFDDDALGVGYELFFLTATDELGFTGDLADAEYGWRHRIAGAELRYRDWAAVRLGTIDVEAPSRSGDGFHEGSAYLALSIPRFGIAADILAHPGSRRPDMVMLGVRRTPLPFAGMTFSANGGWLDDERKGVFGVGLTALDDAVGMQAVFEGTPVRLRSVAVRLESKVERVWGDDVWFKAGFGPFLEVSAYNSGAFEMATGRSLVPGAATGLRAFFALGMLSAGVEGFVGVNRSQELNRLTSIVDHTQWGGRLYVRMGI